MVFSRATMLHYHLTANHYPPLPAEMIDAAENAIAVLAERDPSDPLTPTVTVGDREVDAADLADALHLWGFVEADAAERRAS